MNALTRRACATALVLCCLAAAAGAAQAQAGPAAQQKEAAAPLSEGEVRKIDRETGKLTIKHGELKNLGMPPMTMVFRVSDAAALGQLKPGDRIGFVAGKANGQLTAERIRRLQ